MVVSDAMIAQSVKLGAEMGQEHWCPMANLETFYIDREWFDGSMFVADLTLRAINAALLFLEVAITQSYQDIEHPSSFIT
jgi:hypothetical protein